jgi:glycosyltransferase involved in cell wall biosynthesis
LARAPYVLTVHDVLPRTRALLPAYRGFVYPFLVRHAARVIVHSDFAAELLAREARPPEIRVVPHGAPAPRPVDRSEARRRLGWPEEGLVAVLPGVLKQAKLVGPALEATAKGTPWRLALVGPVGSRGLRRAAQEAGALVLESPEDEAYELALAAADCVLCLRSGSVGETNGPLMDALGAGRAILATSTGSIPEVADGAARYCDGSAESIRVELETLADAGVRSACERAASARAGELSWAASAAAHVDVFAEAINA